MIRNNPAMFLKLPVMLVPRELQVEHSGGVKAMTEEQLEQSLAVLKEMIAQRDAGANAKVIEGVAEPVRTRKPRRERKSLSQRVLENVPVPMQQERE